MIHLYRFKDLNIVLDIGSGAVHAVSDAVFDVLSLYGGKWENSGSPLTDPCEAARFGEETLREAVAEINELAGAGMLFSPAQPEEEVSPEGRGAVIKAMCLHAAHDCNMRCSYCFADTGGFSGARSLMSSGTGKAAIDFLLEQSGGRRNLEIDFFGGEPLMNFDVVKELVHYGRSREKEYGKHIRFTLTTNGLLLDDAKTDFINEHMDNVILSIDGRPEVNDRMRKTVNGDGTYVYIIDKLLRFVTARRKARGGSPLYYVRGTFTKYNKDFAEDVRHLAGLGFENISVEPAVTGPEEPWALTEDDLPELFAEYDRLSDLVLESEQSGNPISFFHFKIDLGQGPCVYKRASGCGAGTAYVAVTPEGDIYPCHQFAGEEGFKLGNVHEAAGAGFQNRHYESFEKAHIFAKDECRKCWAKYYCSGGCHANALHFEGSLMKPHRLSCALEKKRLECAIGLAAKRALAHF
ncbi:MAG: thioether cross-link-forming SCIFF peptide maturase [Clostridiales bacterium]|nr:thioether cross-link-forming SCIFF peptide maturase [Clostridiales bacterium]